MSDHDAIVIGAGPNGLTAAIMLARAGWSVLVLEANTEPGGACRSRELMRPGFVHDLGAAFFPFGSCSPAMVELDLPQVGLRWRNAPIESAHPAPDGTCASITTDDERTIALFGGLDEDGYAWQKITRWHAETRERMLDTLLGPLPPIGQAWRFGVGNLALLGEVAMSTGRGYSARRFRSEAARRVLPGLALHTDVGPDDPCGAAVGFVLGTLASSGGFAVPEGGTSQIADAMVAQLGRAGGSLELGVRVDRIITKGGRAEAVRTSAGEDIHFSRAIIADVAAPTLYLEMLEADDVPPRVIAAMKRFPFGFGTFKMDWALDGPVPWHNEDCRSAAVVHAGDSLDDLQRFAEQVRRGELPDNPYLVIGQQSIADETRAPDGCHTLWCYSRAPSSRDWASERELFADRIEARIEGLAPGFSKTILARNITSPPDLETTNENLIGGDLGGGSAQIQHQLFFRPVFPYFNYATPVSRLYLGSSYTHPGAGVHGMCGYNAAKRALREHG